MVQKTITMLTDDIDGSEATQTVPFSLDGNHYEIDLNDGHASELRATLDKFVANGRRVARRGERALRRGEQAVARRSKEELNAIRTWAREHGHTVSDRGRIPTVVLNAYDSAK